MEQDDALDLLQLTGMINAEAKRTNSMFTEDNTGGKLLNTMKIITPNELERVIRSPNSYNPPPPSIPTNYINNPPLEPTHQVNITTPVMNQVNPTPQYNNNTSTVIINDVKAEPIDTNQLEFKFRDSKIVKSSDIFEFLNTEFTKLNTKITYLEGKIIELLQNSKPKRAKKINNGHLV